MPGIVDVHTGSLSEMEGGKHCICPTDAHQIGGLLQPITTVSSVALDQVVLFVIEGSSASIVTPSQTGLCNAKFAWTTSGCPMVCPYCFFVFIFCD